MWVLNKIAPIVSFFPLLLSLQIPGMWYNYAISKALWISIMYTYLLNNPNASAWKTQMI